MIQHVSTLQSQGFRRRSRKYWQIKPVSTDLKEDCHVSLFADAELNASGRPAGTAHYLDFAAFHVTFELGPDNVHFYYHELSESEWEAGGHTSSREIRRHGVDPRQLRQAADVIAERLLQEWGRGMSPRRGRRG